jgi:Tfp pilus assembly protein PilF
LLVILSKEDKRNLVFFGVVAIVLLGSLIYSNILHAPFVLDDYSSIVDNETTKSLKSSFKDVSNTRYITLFSFALNYAAGGANPFGYHVVNVLIHVINALLVYFLVLLICKTPKMAGTNITKQFIAFSAAFLFIAHPVQTQAVTYIAQRAASLATLFYLFSLVMYVKARLYQTEDANAENRTVVRFFSVSSIIYFILSLFSAVLSIKSKPIAVTLPAMIILLEFCFFTGSFHSCKKPFNSNKLLFISIAFLIMMFIPLSLLDLSMPAEKILQDIDISTRETVRISRTDYFFTQFRVIVTYLRLLILPVKQSIDYTYPVYNSFLNISVLLSFVFLLSIASTTAYLFYISRIHKKELRLAVFGLIWFFIALSVESSIIPIRDVIFEHRLYLPSIGIFVAVAVLIDYLIKKPIIKMSAIIIIVCLLSIGTYNRNIVWQSPQTLWEDALKKFPDNIRAYNGLGVIHKQKREYARAAEYLEQGLLINQRYAPLYYNLGDIQHQKGNYEGAIRYFEKALGLTSSYYLRLDILTSLAIAYSERGNNQAALNTFKKAVDDYPREIYPRSNLARQYLKMGEPDRAISVLEEALKVKEAPHLYYDLSAAYKHKGALKKSNYFKQKASALD